MPEAPEVEAVLRALRPLIVGRVIQSSKVIHPIAVRPQSPSFLKARVRRQQIAGVTRQGKYLLIELKNGCLVLHFRFDGQLIWFDEAPSRGVHVDVLLNFGRGSLGFVDRRHFGRVHWYRNAEDAQGPRRLGIDVFSPKFNSPALREILSRSNRPLKALLLDQTKIAGIGNIYSNEALWHSRLDPRRRANRIMPAESRRLHKAIVSTVKRAVECCCDPAPDFRDPNWWFQGLERILRVYRLEGKPCRRCGKHIRRIEQGGRSTYFCRRCQR